MSEIRMERREYFSKVITKEQSRDTGLALVLVLLLIGLFSANHMFYKVAIPVLVLVMVIPVVFHYMAIVWLGFSGLIGSFMSQVLLTIIYFLIVLPVAFVRNLIGIDTLKIRQFRKGTESVMHVRNHLYVPSDIEKPY